MTSIFFRTILIYLILFISLKIAGKRQIGELEVGELVTTLLISEIAAIPIGDSNIPILAAAVPIVFICSLEILISTLKNKSSPLKKIVEGEPCYIIYKGRLNQNELTKNRISINELLMEIRTQGIGDINEIEYAILEQSGNVSLIPKSNKDNYAHCIVIDGCVNESKLKCLGYNKKWLERTLIKRSVKMNDVLLLTITDGGKINLITKEKNSR